MSLGIINYLTFTVIFIILLMIVFAFFGYKYLEKAANSPLVSCSATVGDEI